MTPDLARRLHEIEDLVKADGSLDQRMRLLTLHFWQHTDARFEALSQRMDHLMATVAELKASVDALMTKVTANTDALGAVRDLIAGLKAMIADLQTQLSDAIANNDPVALQGVADGLAAVNTKLDEQQAAEAALANT